MAKKINVLAELLKCALFETNIDDEVKQTISENASVVYSTALRHDLAHLMEHAVTKSAIEISDEELSYNLLKQKAMSVMRYEDISNAQKQVSELFETEKIPFVLLKGAVIRNYYPEPWMRTSCDIDVLVHECDFERAKKAAVEKLGFSYNGEMHYHDISLHSDTGVHVELHFNIKENMDNVDKLLEKVWEYASPVKEGAYEHLLTNEFFMFQNVAHMSYHFVGGGCGIRSFVDLFLLEKSFPFDRKKLLYMLEETGIKTFYEASVRYAEVWFTEREHDEVTRLMHSYLLGGGAYGSKEKSLAIKMADKGKGSYFFRRIFMPYEQLIISYPELKKRPYLAPLYQIKRWSKVFSAGKLSRSVKEVSTGNSITEQQVI